MVVWLWCMSEAIQWIPIRLDFIANNLVSAAADIGFANIWDVMAVGWWWRWQWLLCHRDRWIVVVDILVNWLLWNCPNRMGGTRAVAIAGDGCFCNIGLMLWRLCFRPRQFRCGNKFVLIVQFVVIVRWHAISSDRHFWLVLSGTIQWTRATMCYLQYICTTVIV